MASNLLLMKQRKFGIIGCGRIAKRHAQHITSVGILQSVCDQKKEKADLLAREYRAKSFGSVKTLLAEGGDLDVIAVCSPNGLHAKHTIECLEAGYHVLCEKPMATTTKDCLEMIQAAEINNKKIFVVKQNRFNPPVIAVKSVINEGKLGKIYSVQLNCFWNRNDNYYMQSDWKGDKSLDGGTLFTQFSHFIDLLYWMIGDVKEVSGLVGNFGHQEIIDFEDNGVINIVFENGALGAIHYTVNSFQKNMEGSITIFGEKGTVKIGGQYLNELEYQQIQGFEITDLPKGNPPNFYGEYVGSMSNHGEVYKNVVDVLDHEAKIATSAFEGLKTVEIIEKIYREVTRF